MENMIALLLKYWKPLAIVVIVGGMFIEERNRARDAATRAARALCVENDIDPAVCAGL
jgi:hypothetical protein